jgi:glycosyltransferase involved in cell wall biosynthesis
MRVALVHDHLFQHGGAERVLEVMMSLYPTAPIYTLLYDKRAMDGSFGHKEIHESFLRSFPGSHRFLRYLLPLMPAATEGYDLRGYDVVLSSVSAFAKGVITHPGTAHVCYMHTPTRYLWTDSVDYLRELRAPAPVKALLPPVLSALRAWDYQAAQRPTVLLANSRTVQQRIRHYYQREAQVLHPPVDTHLFFPSSAPKTYFLAGGRLVSYKRFDLVVDACTALRLPLKIFGSGPAEADLRRRAGPTVEFMGRVSDRTRAELYADALAFINPQEEDFGLTVVEAMAAGRPVIAFAKGGATETVQAGVTGTFFHEQSVAALQNVLSGFAESTWRPDDIRGHAETFSTPRFRAALQTHMQAAYENRR